MLKELNNKELKQINGGIGAIIMTLGTVVSLLSGTALGIGTVKVCKKIFE